MAKPARRLRRFFSSHPIPQVGSKTFLSQAETRHAKKTIRLKEGDACLIVDGKGTEAEALICEFSSDGTAWVKIVRLLKEASISIGKVGKSSFLIHLYPAMLKKGKMDFLMEKAQEWGAEAVYPIETERSEVKMSADKKKQALSRWERITREAAKQSGGLTLTKMEAPQGLGKAVGGLHEKGQIGIFHPSAQAMSFPLWLDDIKKRKSEGEEMVIQLFLGPEGGFSDKEVKAIMSAKLSPEGSCHMVSLGPTVLKADTAFIGVLSALKLMV